MPQQAADHSRAAIGNPWHSSFDPCAVADVSNPAPPSVGTAGRTFTGLWVSDALRPSRWFPSRQTLASMKSYSFSTQHAFVLDDISLRPRDPFSLLRVRNRLLSHEQENREPRRNGLVRSQAQGHHQGSSPPRLIAWCVTPATAFAFPPKPPQALTYSPLQMAVV